MLKNKCGIWALYSRDWIKGMTGSSRNGFRSAQESKRSMQQMWTGKIGNDNMKARDRIWIADGVTVLLFSKAAIIYVNIWSVCTSALRVSCQINLECRSTVKSGDSRHNLFYDLQHSLARSTFGTWSTVQQFHPCPHSLSLSRRAASHARHTLFGPRFRRGPLLWYFRRGIWRGGR